MENKSLNTYVLISLMCSASITMIYYYQDVLIVIRLLVSRYNLYMTIVLGKWCEHTKPIQPLK